ncbi:MAG: hypothetical protein Q8N63_04375 [Nanoarchaeota archaeon]|nr:hypothetical protein [Nanoarchaeota archaeon]
MGDIKISGLVNAISRDTLENEAILLKRRIELSNAPAFIMGYCASDSETFEEVVRYLQEQVAVQHQPLEVTLEPNQRNLISYFLEHTRELQSLYGEVALVKSRRFERLSGFSHQSKSASRVAHDYDQDVCQNQKSLFPNLLKKILVVTQIDPSAGRESYDMAVKSACQSRFKSFLYEFFKYDN